MPVLNSAPFYPFTSVLLFVSFIAVFSSEVPDFVGTDLFSACYTNLTQDFVPIVYVGKISRSHLSPPKIKNINLLLLVLVRFQLTHSSYRNHCSGLGAVPAPDLEMPVIAAVATGPSLLAWVVPAEPDWWLPHQPADLNQGRCLNRR